MQFFGVRIGDQSFGLGVDQELVDFGKRLFTWGLLAATLAFAASSNPHSMKKQVYCKADFMAGAKEFTYPQALIRQFQRECMTGDEIRAELNKLVELNKNNHGYSKSWINARAAFDKYENDK